MQKRVAPSALACSAFSRTSSTLIIAVAGIGVLKCALWAQ